MKEKNLGLIGEDIAAEYLINEGFRIIERNFRRPWGEIDIIAKSPDRSLVFVEVKSMRQKFSLESLSPEDHMTKSKIKKVRRTASLYAGENEKLINERNGWRIDLIAIDFVTDSKNNIRHYINL